MNRQQRYILGVIGSVGLVVTTVTWAQDNGPNPVRWWETATGIIGIISGILGLPTAYWLSQKYRYETRKLQLEILEKEGKLPKKHPRVLRREHIIDSPQAIVTGIQGFVIRFIILYVAILGWDIIERFITPFISASIAYWLSEHPEVSQEWKTILGLSAYSQITGIGKLLIFLLLGWPLLSDITAFIGVRPFKLSTKGQS
jgi:hypothetical protein